MKIAVNTVAVLAVAVTAELGREFGDDVNVIEDGDMHDDNGKRYIIPDIDLYRRWGADPKLVEPCPRSDHRCRTDILYAQIHKTTQVPLKNAKFDDDKLFQCPASMIISWTAKNAIDGKKYCMTAAECDAPGRLAHSKKKNATFTAQFKNAEDTKKEIGHVLWWPREDCCQNQHKNLVVKVNDQECYPITEYNQQRLPDTGLDQNQIVSRTDSSEIVPMVFKCPEDTYGDHISVYNPTYFTMITEIEVWTRDTGVPTTPYGAALNLKKADLAKNAWSAKFFRSKKLGAKVIDGDKSTYASNTKYSAYSQLYLRFRDKILPKEIHVYPPKNGPFTAWIPDLYVPGGVEVNFHGKKCEPAFNLVNPTAGCRWDSCISHPKDCKRWMCWTEADIVRWHVKAGRPLIYKCPPGTRGYYLKIKQKRELALAEVEIWE